MSTARGAAALLRQLRAHGVELWSAAGKLRYNAPRGIVSDDVLAAMREHKAGLLQLLDAEADSRAVQRVPRRGRMPLSFAQRRIWFLSELEPDSPVYNVVLAKHIRGSVDGPLLARSLAILVRRHEVLRSCCCNAEGGPELQIVAPDAVPEPQLWYRESDLPAATSDAELRRLVAAAGSAAIDLRAAPLLQAQLLRRGAAEAVLVITTHHFAVDGWSCGILLRELSDIYRALATGEPAQPPTQSLQYVDFAAWQTGWLRGPARQEQLDYWREELRGMGTLELPTDKPRPRVQSSRGAVLHTRLDNALAVALRGAARELGSTLYMTLLTTLQILLQRYSGQDEVIVGTAVSNRHSSALEDLVGPFANTLVLRGEVDGDRSFAAQVARTQETAARAFAHQDLPFEVLVEELRPARDRSRSPLFQVLFVLHQYSAAEELALPNADVCDFPVAATTSMYDLVLQVVEHNEQLATALTYNTDLFHADTIGRMQAHFVQLLQAVAADPAIIIDDIPLQEATEQQAAPANGHLYPQVWPHSRVHELVEASARRSPDAPALCAAGQTLSYAELNARANRLARALQALGAGPGQRVAVACGRGCAQVLSVLAVLKAGAAYVPLDPQYPPQRLQFMLADSDAGVVLADSATADNLPPHEAAVLLVDRFDWDAGDGDNLAADCGESVYVIYTSGSTGEPKGVELTHAGLANLLQWQISQPRLDAAARTLQFASLSFDVSFQELFTTWSQGGTVMLIPEELRRDMAQLSRFIAAQAIERLYLPFVALQPLAEHLLPCADKLQLRDVIVAGEQLQITPAVRALFAGLEDAALHNHYGPSETHVVTAWTLPDTPASWPELPPIGRPVSNTAVYVLDPRGRPTPVGVPGELFVAGVQVGLGYCGRPDLSAARFTTDQRGAGRMYRTGDRGRWLADGTLQYLGRMDAQIKVRGFRVEPGEIEMRLLAIPGILQSAVILAPAAAGEARLIAYVVPAAGAGVTAAMLRARLQDELPDYMIPAAFVTLDAMPLTPSGKLNRAALPAPVWAAADTYVGPATPTESALQLIWADLLGLEQPGVQDDFFALGGHSLLATKLVSRIRDEFGIELALHTVFDQPTITGLATALDTVRPATPTERSLPRADRASPLPLSYAQARLRFLDELEPGNSLYNMPFALQVEGALDTAALQAAVNDVVARHEALRTVFPGGGATATQEVLPASEVAAQYHTVTSPHDFSSTARQLAATPFDLAQGPLLRLHVISAGADRHCLLFVIHHIVCDLWSMDRLFRDLGHFYGVQTGQTQAPLAPLPIQYADYAVWQRDRLTGARLTHLADYWRGALQDAPPVLELPLDRARPAEPSYQGAWLATRISADLTAALERLAGERGCTLFMLTLAVFAALLSKHSAQEDLVVGTPISGRLHSDLEDLIGFFLNTLALRIDLSDDPTCDELLRRVRALSLAAFEHQELPFEQLVEMLQPGRDMSITPVFQHLFICQDNRALRLQLPGLQVQDARLISPGTAKFDLTLSFTRDSAGAEIGIEYATELFAPASAERLLQHYATLLQEVVRAPDEPLSALSIMDDAERNWLLEHGRGRQQDYPAGDCVQRMVEAQVARTPEAPAVRFGDTTLSYAELNAGANGLARTLARHGAGPGKRLAVACARSPQLAVALLAIVKTGACYVPIDADAPAQRCELMLDDSGADLLLTDAATDLQSPRVERVLLDNLSAAPTASNPRAAVTPHDPLYCIYTSGSTGKPKGVVQSHAALANLLAWQQQHPRLGRAQLTLQFAALSFDVSVQEYFGAWTTGGCVYLVPDELRRDLPQLAGVIAATGIERLYLPCAALAALTDGLLRAPQSPAVQDIIVAGEQLQVNDALRRLGERLEGCALHNHYGPTETHVVTALTLAGPARDWPALPTIGTPLPNNECYVLDPHGQLAARGTPGELCVGGAQVALGYLERPELEAERFMPHPFGGSGRVYRTGDLVRWLDSGQLEFLGRRDTQLKWRGFRIETGEIESAMTAVPGIAGAAVVLQRNSTGPDQLAGYFTTRASIAPAAAVEQIRAHLKARLPDYMCPTVLIAVDEWPLTRSGKIDRRRLPPPPAGTGEDAGYVAPRNDLERVLTAIWADVLGLPQAGIHDDFFVHGGHSLLAARLITRVAEQLELQLPLKYLFRYPTPLELAAAITTLKTARHQPGRTDSAPRDEFTI
ncbi:MAG: amino acid adenylation domain-containing protein [Gammaproteobacteria bacterium]|jgi:amino acid adenylation domain-containing protein|nr:amino acid adenylation domain-containing protein [Gammaproteobacteria bacterium]